MKDGKKKYKGAIKSKSNEKQKDYLTFGYNTN